MKLPRLSHDYARTLMRITIAQLLCTVLFLNMTYARTVEAQALLEQSISLSVEDKEIRLVLSKIEKAARVTFSYIPQQIQADRKVSINISNQRLSTVLDQLFKSTSITYEVVGKKQILLSIRPPFQPTTPNSLPQHAQLITEPAVDRTITGVVNSEKGEGLPGLVWLSKVLHVAR
ncbi:hypothetical protein GO730_16895 [Spirosoma sp. HMF3257]|uniref:Secretin/TonB short N-terminal domain-containing protein n=1 Tax=Spirosoma telluris TaxID=2183553 RepID=A0A327NJN9_9BACT|nr:hypothetical protein [Spirosoma telluris]RAI75417.1 hypothetical protein HMF3257_16820 [Spirosoma telluris]